MPQMGPGAQDGVTPSAEEGEETRAPGEPRKGEDASKDGKLNEDDDMKEEGDEDEAKEHTTSRRSRRATTRSRERCAFRRAHPCDGEGAWQRATLRATTWSAQRAGAAAMWNITGAHKEEHDGDDKDVDFWNIQELSI